jgi:hypothetical protein
VKEVYLDSPIFVVSSRQDKARDDTSGMKYNSNSRKRRGEEQDGDAIERVGRRKKWTEAAVKRLLVKVV